MKSFLGFGSRGRIDVPRRSTAKWLVGAGKLPGNVRSVGNGFGYESEIVILKAVVGFVKFWDETGRNGPKRAEMGRNENRAGPRVRSVG